MLVDRPVMFLVIIVLVLKYSGLRKECDDRVKEGDETIQILTSSQVIVSELIGPKRDDSIPKNTEKQLELILGNLEDLEVYYRRLDGLEEVDTTNTGAKRRHLSPRERRLRADTDMRINELVYRINDLVDSITVLARTKSRLQDENDSDKQQHTKKVVEDKVKHCLVGSEEKIDWDFETDKLTSKECVVSTPSDLTGLDVHKNVVFVGASILYRTFSNCVGKFGGYKRTKRCGRCDRNKYLGIERPMNGSLLDLETAGPVAYGQIHPGCTDCSGCNSMLYTNSKTGRYLEYIAMEFSLDYSLYDGEFSTQQQIATYLQRKPVQPDLIVIDIGSHDILINDSAWKANIEYLTHIFSEWKTVFLIAPRPLDLEQRTKMEAFNKVLLETGVRNVIRGDIISRFANETTSNKAYSDNVHPRHNYFYAIFGILYHSFINNF